MVLRPQEERASHLREREKLLELELAEQRNYRTVHDDVGQAY